MNESAEKQEKKGGMEKYFFRASAEDFKKIPGSPIAYWVSKNTRNIFMTMPTMFDSGHPCSGIQTGDNDRYLRQWFEVEIKWINFDCTPEEFATSTENKWLPHKKGGEFRKWYGNCDYVMDWRQKGKDIMSNPSARPQNLSFMCKEGVTWSHTSSGKFGCRLSNVGFTFNVEAPTYFSKNNLLSLGYLCSIVAHYFMELLSPTLHFLVGTVKNLPMPDADNVCINISSIQHIVSSHRYDWDAYETSWDFTTLPLLHPDYRQSTLEATYRKLRVHWQNMTLEMQRLEEENNRIFIEAYGLEDELTPEVPLNEITLTCNPYYRYGKEPQVDTDTHGSEKQKEEISVHPCSSVVQKQFPINEELEAKLLSDTIKEFISYAVGCMFGRYSLDKPGLILANQGETIEDYYRKLQEPQIDTDTHGSEKQKEKISVHPCSSVVQSTFEPDKDNVIPILDGDWFIDDIVERFRIFLRTTFGEEHYEENLKFIENAIGKDIRKYFLKNFYTDHVKRYKKRPIYWLFSSPRGSFNALIYMHRYQPDTISIILNDYLREFRTKLIARREHLEQVSISASAKKTEKTKALKEIEKLKKTIEELDTYENEILYPLATQKIEIDLDDGVKVNYKKFGTALKKVPGLS